MKADGRHPLVPRETKRWRDSIAVEPPSKREFGCLKHDYGLAPLRVHGLAKVAFQADLTMLARPSAALARARAVALGT